MVDSGLDPACCSEQWVVGGSKAPVIGFESPTAKFFFPSLSFHTQACYGIYPSHGDCPPPYMDILVTIEDSC